MKIPKRTRATRDTWRASQWVELVTTSANQLGDPPLAEEGADEEEVPTQAPS